MERRAEVVWEARCDAWEEADPLPPDLEVKDHTFKEHGGLQKLHMSPI